MTTRSAVSTESAGSRVSWSIAPSVRGALIASFSSSLPVIVKVCCALGAFIRRLSANPKDRPSCCNPIIVTLTCAIGKVLLIFARTWKTCLIRFFAISNIEQKQLAFIGMLQVYDFDRLYNKQYSIVPRTKLANPLKLSVLEHFNERQ